MNNVVSICDRTGIAVEPWRDAGYQCYCVDIQHPRGVTKRKDGVILVGADIHELYPGHWWLPQSAAFAMAMPDCTYLTVSGNRWQDKRGPGCVGRGLLFADACWRLLISFGCPWWMENPAVGRLSTWRKPDYAFHPWEYAGYNDDIETDNTSKKTGLWVGGGFIMPPRSQHQNHIATTAGLWHRQKIVPAREAKRRVDLPGRCLKRTTNERKRWRDNHPTDAGRKEKGMSTAAALPNTAELNEWTATTVMEWWKSEGDYLCLEDVPQMRIVDWNPCEKWDQAIEAVKEAQRVGTHVSLTFHDNGNMSVAVQSSDQPGAVVSIKDQAAEPLYVIRAIYAYQRAMQRIVEYHKDSPQ